MKEATSPQKPQAFLTKADFHLLKDLLDAYIKYLGFLKQESGGYQALYTKVELAVIVIDGNQPTRVDFDHEELKLLLKAVIEFDAYLRSPNLDNEFAQYIPLLTQQVGLLWLHLFAATPVAYNNKCKPLH